MKFDQETLRRAAEAVRNELENDPLIAEVIALAALEAAFTPDIAAGRLLRAAQAIQPLLEWSVMDSIVIAGVALNPPRVKISKTVEPERDDDGPDTELRRQRQHNAGMAARINQKVARSRARSTPGHPSAPAPLPDLSASQAEPSQSSHSSTPTRADHLDWAPVLEAVAGFALQGSQRLPLGDSNAGVRVTRSSSAAA